MRGKVTQEMFADIPEIDFDSGYKYFLGNMDNYKQALLSTLKSVKAKLPILQSMIASREYEGLRTIAQTLRRMLSNIGANEFAELTYQLESELLNEGDDLPKMVLNYSCNLVTFSEHLENLLKKMDKNTDKREDQVSFLNFDFTKTRESIKLSSNLLERKII